MTTLLAGVVLLLPAAQDDAAWTREAYEKIKQFAKENLQRDYPDIDRDILGTAKGKKYLKMTYTIPGIFCQAGYDGYVRAQILQMSSDLAKRYEEIKKDRPADKIAEEILARYRDEYFMHWDKFLDGVELEEFSNVDFACDRLKALSAKGDTAYWKLFEKVWTGRVLVVAGKQHNKPADNCDWLPDALGALQKLLNAVLDFAQSADPGERFRACVDEGKLSFLAKAFSSARRDLLVALDGVDASLESRVRRILEAPLTRTREALQKEARDEINKLWNEQARPLYEQHLKDRYPLNRDPKMKDIEMVQFATFFSPKSRYFAAIQEYAIQLNNIKIGQQPLLKFSDDFRRAMAVVSGYGDKEMASQSFHAVLWHASPEKPQGDEKVSVTFTIKARAPIGSITQIQLKILKDPFDLSKSIEKNEPMRRTVTWEQGNDVFMRISVGTNVAIPYEDKPGHHWGLFRLMDALKIDQKKLNEYALSYEYAVDTFVNFTLKCEGGDNPFAKDFFSRFAFPEKVAGE